MDPLGLTITNAGLSAFTAAQLGEDINLQIAEVGFTADDFVLAPTLTQVPGEFRRLSTVSGLTTSPETIHLTVRDAEAITYQVRGFGLYLADGTLFAVYGQQEMLLEKSTSSIALLALDLRFPPGQVAEITFGDANFLNPVASETVPGVARVATPAQVVAGTDDDAFVTPGLLKALLPVGTVTMWWGAANAVPAGWAICDGSDVARSDGTGTIATPDLRNRVPVGAGGLHQSGDTFGLASRNVQTSDAGAHTPSGTLPSHDHGVDLATARAQTGLTTSETRKTETAGGGTDTTLKSVTLNDPGHEHAISGRTTASGDLALTMDAVPAHKHALTVDVTQPSLVLYFIMRV